MPRDKRAGRKHRKQLTREAMRRAAKITVKFPDKGKAEFRPGDGSRYGWDAEGNRWRCAKCGWGVVPRVLYRPQFAHDKACTYNPERRGAKKKREG